MPKREKTPSPSRDEPKYFTVVHPWPGHLDLSLPGDGKKMCKWLAAACGKSDPIMSFFYRPDSPGLCIIEIAREWAEQHARRLLGCHSWHEFLCDKSNTANNATSVFYSHYASHREVQKMGWKNVHLDDSWFEDKDREDKGRKDKDREDKDREDKDFVKPYPRPTWCPPPAHDTTGHSFCRALPVNQFPEGSSANAPAIPVGSKQWIDKKATTPALTMSKESRPTLEPYSPTFDDDWGPPGGIFEFSDPAVVTENLYEEDGTTTLTSDLPIASFDKNVDHKSLCPYHGQTCKKGVCDWRAKYAKKMERECGYPKGPSNNKNYNPRRNNSRNHLGSPPPGDHPNGSNRDGTQADVGGSARGTPTRGTPSLRGNAWSRGRPPALAANRTYQPSASTPGQGNGTGRGGQPAWAPTRGRKAT